MLLGLKIAIIKNGRPQYKISAALGWDPSKISKIIAEKYEPSSLEKEDLAAELGVSVDEIFPHENKGSSVK